MTTLQTSLINAVLSEKAGLSSFELAVDFDISAREVFRQLAPLRHKPAPDSGERVLRYHNENWAFKNLKSTSRYKGPIKQSANTNGIAPWRTMIAEFEKGTLKVGEVVTGAFIKSLHNNSHELDLQSLQMDLAIHRAPLRFQRVQTGYQIRLAPTRTA